MASSIPLLTANSANRPRSFQRREALRLPSQGGAVLHPVHLVCECESARRPDGGASGTALRVMSSQLAETVLSVAVVLASDWPVRSGPAVG